MYYLYSIDNDSWYDKFSSVGYATLIDMRTGNTVLMTHGSADGHLPRIERAGEWELLARVDQVVCCYQAWYSRDIPYWMWWVTGERSPI